MASSSKDETRDRELEAESGRGRGEVWWPGNWSADAPEELAIDVVIPALNEEESLPLVLRDLPSAWVRRVVVVDNGSRDATAERARASGAEVVSEPEKGYGRACQAGIEHLAGDPPDIVVFLDADHSDFPAQLPRVVSPITSGHADLSVGSRTIGDCEPGALAPRARFGNRLACTLMEIFYGYRFTDLGPFRAISWEALQTLDMRDPDFGWTVEMQVKAAEQRLRAVEVPVDYRRRAVGASKITGTVKGSVMAGYKIIWTILSHYTST